MNTTNNIKYFFCFQDKSGYYESPVYFDHELTEQERINFLQTTEKHWRDTGNTATVRDLYKDQEDGISIQIEPGMHIPKEQIKQLIRIMQNR